MLDLQAGTVRRLRSRAVRDGIAIALVAVLIYLTAAHFDVVNRLSEWFIAHEDLQVDELAVVAAYLVVAAGVFVWRRRSELLEQIRERERVEGEKNALVPALERALREIQTLSSLLPVCAWCKRIRDDDGTWSQVDAYISRHTNIAVTHGICPDCAEKLHEPSAGE